MAMSSTVQDLERAVEAPEIVRALRGYGLTQQDVGTIAGVSDRAVRQWRQAGIRRDRYDRLVELREIALLLSDSLSPRGVGQWLHARNRLLQGERAVDLLAQGKGDQVRVAAKAFIDGAYV
jgi:transcriptional regulator with XRE-family HTH domain